MRGTPITVVLPVRNGGEYLKLCVQSILAQTMGDFDLVVLDNASTDGSMAFLSSLPDSRIRVMSSGRPLRIEDNWARISTISKNEYLTIIGHDDLFDREFLAVALDLIAAEPDAALYHTHFRLIDSGGFVLRDCQPMPAREFAAEFLAARFLGKRDSYGTGYVMRSRAYDAAGGIPPFAGLLFADDALWVRLIGNGYKATSLRHCFSYRFHANSAQNAAPNILLESMSAYLSFLSQQSSDDPAFLEVMQRYGGDYFAVFANVAYAHALIKASEADHRLPSDFAERLDLLLAPFGREISQIMKGDLRLRLLERFNRNLLRKPLTMLASRVAAFRRGPRSQDRLGLIGQPGI